MSSELCCSMPPATISEIAVELGPDRGLSAVLTTPVAPGAAQVACLLMNAGVVHRVGPHRINVKLARRAASHGIECLRLDLSGLGDSASSKVAGTAQQRIIGELRLALDYLERERGIRRVAAVGVCSGAVNAYYLALADPRVTGIMMFDGFAFDTRKARLVRRWLSLRYATWKQLARRLQSPLWSTLSEPQLAVARHVNVPTRTQFAGDLDRLIDRGTAVYIAHSHALDAYNYRNQLRDAFRGARFLTGIRFDYLPEVDHTFTPLFAQRVFIDRVTDWLIAQA